MERPALPPRPGTALRRDTPASYPEGRASRGGLPAPRPPEPSGVPPSLVAALVLLLLAPPALAGWLGGAALLRTRLLSRWLITAAAATAGVVAVLVIGPQEAL